MKTMLGLLILILTPPCVSVSIAHAAQELVQNQPMPPAPPPPPPRQGLGQWWKSSAVVRELGLSETQVKEIERTFLEHRLKLIDLRAALEREEAQFQPLVEADQPDETKVSAQLDRVLGARNKLEKENTMMMLAIRKVLNLEQWRKLQDLQERQNARPSSTPAPPLPPAPPKPQ